MQLSSLSPWQIQVAIGRHRSKKKERIHESGLTKSAVTKVLPNILRSFSTIHRIHTRIGRVFGAACLAIGLQAEAYCMDSAGGLESASVSADAPIRESENETKVLMQNKYLEQITPVEYARWVAYVKSRPAEERVWLRTLEDQLGSFYGPRYMKGLINMSPKITPETDAWAYVKDDPALPRVLIIGDSISRSYTAPVRMALAGKANVHRAPANCGHTGKFFEHGEVWLMQNGSNQWDIITVNFGIHDHGKKPETYAANLRKIIDRLRETGAKVFWVRTTPWGKKEDPADLDLSPSVNATADAFIQEDELEAIDLHSVVKIRRADLQYGDHCHFKDSGTLLMGQAVSEAIEPYLSRAQE